MASHVFGTRNSQGLPRLPRVRSRGGHKMTLRETGGYVGHSIWRSAGPVEGGADRFRRAAWTLFRERCSRTSTRRIALAHSGLQYFWCGARGSGRNCS